MNTTIPERTRTRANGLAVVGTALHAVLGAALFAGFVSYVPAGKKVFDTLGMSLPLLTQKVLKLSDWIVDHRRFVVPAIGLLLALDFVVIWALGRRGWFSLPLLWVLGIALLIFGAGAITTFAIESPMRQLRDGLSR